MTAFLGYELSPKWFNISNKGNVIKYNKVNSKRLFNKSIVKRGYCTSRSSNSLEISERLKLTPKGLGLSPMEMEKLGEADEGAPVYVYENLNLEDTRKQILNDTRGLSGIYMIVNKTTKDYYIGSAATNRFYARFRNHVINFTGSKIVKLAIKKYDFFTITPLSREGVG